MIPALRKHHGSILIVDRCSESREVLKTVLERKGATIYEATDIGRGLEMAKMIRPQVIVLDAEEEAGCDFTICAEYEEQVDGEAKLVVLGGSVQLTSQLSADQVVAKPYHYGPLVRKIITLLEQESVVSEQPSGVSLRHSRTRSRKAI
ncbi:MAG: DNA-binding response OmpR family regulator [Pirellulaceae bacterium]|jgi:DNA-binding response OmpR family regulator